MNKLCMKGQQNVNNAGLSAIRKILFTPLHTASTGFTARQIHASYDSYDALFGYPQLRRTLLTIIKVLKWF
jgi:hypothetical protein